MTATTGLGGYEEWPAFMAATPRLPGLVAALLGVPLPRAGEATVGEVVVRDGVRATHLSWPVGFGPAVGGWLLHAEGVDPAALPGVLALHSHGGIKFLGAERMVDLPDLPAHVTDYRTTSEGGHAFATELAHAGFTVLAPDAFTWGSRRFDLGTDDPSAYDEAAREHEHYVAKACSILDTTYAGMVAHDDLTALQVLRRHCAPGPVGAVGFSGGGGRVAALCSLEPGLGAAVIVAMMTRIADLLPDHAGHSWLLHSRGLASGPDLPGLAAGERTHHLMVVFCDNDHLFPPAGMQAADAALAAAFADALGSYTPVHTPDGHQFTASLQREAITHLTNHLRHR